MIAPNIGFQHTRSLPARRNTLRQRNTSQTCARLAETGSVAGTKQRNDQGIKLFVRSNWKQAWAHGSLAGGNWQDYELLRVPSAPRWMSAQFETNGVVAASPLLEFVLTNGMNDWDKPAAGGNYTIQEPGRYSLRNNTISKVLGEPVLLVSDLDGTMVGDDAATAAFKSWWEDNAVMRGGLLVYNTGRSLGSFEKLLSSKAEVLAVPDMLISAVGTKLYKNSGSQWAEDKGWSSMLDQGWKLQEVREAAYRALSKVGKDNMHFRPPEEQNDHKVTCGVNVNVLDKVLDMIKKALNDGGVQVNLITSGVGEWRFMDLVPIRAGKLEALNYVRRSHGFPTHRTLACGDSGNDILMLSGENLAVAVGNSQPDLVHWVRQRQAEEAGAQRLLMSQRHEAYGILEALEHFGLK